MKKDLIFLTLCLLLFSAPNFAQIISNFQTPVSINEDGSSPNSSAILDVQSTAKGMLVPRLTTVQRKAIVSPAAGLLVFDTDINTFFFYTSAEWKNMTEQLWTQNAAGIHTNQNVGIGTPAPDANAILELNSGNKAFLPPRMGFESIKTIANPVAGMMVYDTEFNCTRTYNGSRWECPSGHNGGFFAPPGNFYGVPAGGAFNDVGKGVAIDNESNVYVTGFFEDTVSFGNLTASSSGSLDIFIVKYKNNGTVAWVQTAGGTSGDFGFGITTDASGNVYVTGTFKNTATFGPTSITSAGEEDVFIAKYNSGGTLQWVQQAGGTLADHGSKLSVDDNNNVFVTGHFSGSALFGATTLNSVGDWDMFVAKYDTDGNLGWVQQAGGTDKDGGRGISIDTNGNVCISGFFKNTATFGVTMITTVDSVDVFVAKYSTNGILQWVQQAGGKMFDISFGLTTDPDNNIFISGHFQDSISFGADTLISKGHWDVFIAKYDTNGNLQWVQHAGGPDMDTGSGIIADSLGNVYVTGAFSATLNFGTTTMASAGDGDIFLAKYDTNGGLQWVQQAGGMMFDSGAGIDIGPCGRVYVTGSFQDRATFGNNILTANNGSNDIFLWKYAE